MPRFYLLQMHKIPLQCFWSKLLAVMLVRYGKAGERNGKTVEILVERIEFGFLPLTLTVSEHKMLIFIVV